MKKFIFTLFLFVVISTGYSQNTYYWVGGASGAWNLSASWNTTLGGGGTARVANTADILIFDGSNIGGGATGAVVPTAITSSATQTFGQLILQNGASVTLQRGSSSGTGAINIAGDGGPSDDLQVDATSTLIITAPTASWGINVFLQNNTSIANSATIYGSLIFNDNGLYTARFTPQGNSVINFASGSKCYVKNTVAGNYPFGSSNLTSPQVFFLAGSTCYLQGGLSPFTQTTTNLPIAFSKGSTFEIDASISNTSNVFSRHYFGNVVIANNAVVNADAAFYNVDTLTVTSGATFNLSTSGGYAVAGDIVNNGTIGSASNYKTSQIIMVGTVPQTVSGAGTFNGISGFSVATDADVTLSKNLLIGSDTIVSGITSNIIGKLNIGTSVISSLGLTSYGNIAFNGAATATTNGSVSGNIVTLDAGAYATGINTANVEIGSLVTGTGIPANSYIISTSSATSSFTMSKAATGTPTSFTISNGAATLTTANTNGVDGCIATAGSKSFATGVNYVFNAATTAPFSTASNNAAGNVTFNSAATTNQTQAIGGTLTLNSGNLTINNTDTLRLLSAASISGTSASRYIVTKTSGVTVGTLRMDGFSTVKTFPVGSATNYLPATITPSAIDTFNVSVFEGLTTNGLPNGTAFNATQKQSAINAVWVINPLTNKGQSSSILLKWVTSLAGSRFLTFTNAQIGIGRNDGTNWFTTIATSANNTAQTATATYNAYGSFGIGELSNILPVSLVSFSANVVANAAKLTWASANESGIANYTIQKSADATSFTDIGVIVATNNTAATTNYSFIDVAFTTTSYYRLKIVTADGTISYSNILVVKNGTQPKLSTYPNPVTNTLTISGLKGGEVLNMYDVSGKLLLTKNIPFNTATFSVNVSQLTVGMYYIKVISSDTNTIQTIIKN